MLLNEQLAGRDVYISFDLVSSGDRRYCITEDAKRCHMQVLTRPWVWTGVPFRKVMWGKSTCDPVIQIGLGGK